MPILTKGVDFTTGDQVTAANLDNLVDAATFAAGAVDNSTTQLSSGAIIVKDGGITGAKLASNIAISSTGAITGSTITATTQLIGKGTATNDDAATGYIGEYASGTRAIASALNITAATPTNVTSVSLTAGDWDVSGTVGMIPSGSASITKYTIGISTTSATLAGFDAASDSFFEETVPGNGITYWDNTPTVRISISGTTTVYLVVNCTHNTSPSVAAAGTIRARRVR